MKAGHWSLSGFFYRDSESGNLVTRSQKRNQSPSLGGLAEEYTYTCSGLGNAAAAIACRTDSETNERAKSSALPFTSHTPAACLMGYIYRFVSIFRDPAFHPVIPTLARRIDSGPTVRLGELLPRRRPLRLPCNILAHSVPTIYGTRAPSRTEHKYDVSH